MKYKGIIAVYQDGRYEHYERMSIAAEANGVTVHRISECGRLNQARQMTYNGRKINSDHHCNGVRYYFDYDMIWKTKVGISWEVPRCNLYLNKDYNIRLSE